MFGQKELLRLHYLDKLNLLISRIFVCIAGSALVAMMTLAVINMFLRAFYVPFGATWEVVAFLTAITTAFALSYAQLHKVHVSIDLVVRHFPPRTRAILESITHFLSICLFGIAAWHLYLYAGRVQAQGVLSETLRIPFYPLIYAVSVAFVSFTLVLIADFIKTLIGVIKK